MFMDAPLAMKWDNPEPGVYEASAKRTRDVALEVFAPLDDEDADEYVWWAFSEGRRVASGYADSLKSAKQQCELAAA